MDQGNRFSPVTLAGKDPVAQLVIHLAFAHAVLNQPVDDGLFRFRDGKAVEKTAVDKHAIGHIGISGLLHILPAGDHLKDRQPELFGEFPVARIVRGNGHDGARAVCGEHIVGDKHRDSASVDRIDGLDSLELHARLFLDQLGALKVAFARGRIPVGENLVPVFNARTQLIHRRMLRRHNHVRRAEKRIRPRGINAQLHIAVLNGKIHLCALAAADPVALLHLDLFDKIEIIQPVEQLLGIGGDFEHPLALHAADDLCAAALAFPGHNLLVGQAALAARAPVDRHLAFISKAVLVKLQKNPLRPPEVTGVGGIHFARPVKREADALELLAEVIDILLGHAGRMDMVFDGIVFRRQAECVPTDGEEHVVALHPALAGDDIHGRVAARVAHMQPRAGWIRELDERIVFGLFMAGLCLKAMGLLPAALPLELNFFGIVSLAHGINPPLSSLRRDRKGAPDAHGFMHRGAWLKRGTTLIQPRGRGPHPGLSRGQTAAGYAHGPCLSPAELREE